MSDVLITFWGKEISLVMPKKINQTLRISGSNYGFESLKIKPVVRISKDQSLYGNFYIKCDYVLELF